MLQEKTIIDRMRIASPCPSSWEGMKGDKRTRFCDLCSLHVYNISEMTPRDVEKLLSDSEGRICARLYKRADGTVLTKDCPVGLRAIRRRMSRIVGACAAAIFSFYFSIMGQRSTQEEKTCPTNAKVRIERTVSQRLVLRGIIKDPNGAVVSGAPVTLINKNTKKEFKTLSNDEGSFEFATVEVGLYDLLLSAAGFRSLEVKKLEVVGNQAVCIDLMMELDGTSVFIGVVGENPQIDASSSTLKTVFNSNQIIKLPF